jgi:hypothetical protein
MSYKIEIQNNFFVVTDTATGIEEIREVRDQVKWRVSGSIYSFFYNIANLVDQNSPNIIRLGENAKEFDFSEIVDSTETPFASRAIFNDLLNVNLGFMIRETSSVWGLITGDINDQTDLQTILNGKFDDPTGDTTQYIAGDGTLITFPVSGQAGTLVREVRNTTGATLTKGTIVYINGANGNKPTIAKALATSDATSAQTFGFLQSNIANNAVGYAVVMGDLIGLNTSAITEGTQLYLSSTVAGEYTTTKQVAPAHLVYVGIVTRSHPTQGQIEVKIQNGYELDELHDVLIVGETDGQVLQFEGASGLWKNKTLATGLTVGSTAISSGTDGRVLFQNGGVLQQSSALSFASGTFKVISNGAVNSVSVRNSLDTFDIFSISNGGAVLSSFLQVNGGLSSNIQFTATDNGRWVKMVHDYGQLQFTNSLGNNTFTLGNNGITYFSGNTNIGGGTNGARLDVKAQGALSTDIAFRVRNSANTLDIIRANGAGEVFIGLGAGNVNTGANNTFIGISSGLVNTSGANNIGIGINTLKANTTGQENIAIGINALLSNTTALYNIAIGLDSLRTNTTGANNTGTGQNSLRANTIGSANSGFGSNVLYSNTTGDNNSSFGGYSLYLNTTGSGNIAFGANAGRYIADSSANSITNNSVYLGFNTRALADNQTNQIVIGHNAIGLGSNTAVIGNDSIVKTVLKGSIGIGTTSPVASAKVQIDSTTQGFLPPRMTNAERTAIASPAVGLMVYCTDATEGLYIYKSTGWTFVI